MQMSTPTFEWTPPGPGHWRRDDSHIPGTISLHMWELLTRIFDAGMRDGLERYGVLLDHFDMRRIGGRGWLRPRAIGAPEKPGAPPPRFIFRLLLRLHPTLRRRVRQAERVIEGRLWREDVRVWREELADKVVEHNLALQRRNPRSLSDAALASHLVDCRNALLEGATQHFRQAMSYQFTVGDWLRHTCDWTGTSPSQALAALRGCSPASAQTMDAVARVARAVADDPQARALLHGAGDPEARLSALRQVGPAVRVAVDAYLDRYGNSIVTGFDLCEKTLLELPDVVLSTFAAALEAGAIRPSANADEVAVRLRAKVAPEHHAEYDAMLAEARLTYGLRDEDVCDSWTWRAGLLRRAMLECGRRLSAKGALVEAVHVFETTPEELDALMAGDGPPAAELDARAVERAGFESVDAPISLGEPEIPPPDDYFPPATRRIMQGVMFYVAHTDLDGGAPPESSSEQTLAGLAASPGQYVGRARIVTCPEHFAKIREGDVLVARITSPTYNVLLPLVGAVVTDRGGSLCHAAIVAREFGIPGVVGTREATTTIPDGARVLVDGDRGVVEILPDEADA